MFHLIEKSSMARLSVGGKDLDSILALLFPLAVCVRQIFSAFFAPYCLFLWQVSEVGLLSQLCG